jgi:CheY-like chemotaxis protein
MKTLTEPQRVLLAEDDVQISAGLALVLEMAGYDTRTATNGLEAIAVSRVWRPDVFLLDLVMPRMDGWSFRKQQLEDPALANIPVVILSCCGEAMRYHAGRLGITHCFNKGSSAEEILSLVGDLFDVLDQGDAAQGKRGGKE